ncbi:hypothetical protein [Rhodococcus qingshengii]|uniref:hypothetical protein n=1 Tax=Rhodococcus qingshengii TaxID=334542 RepID=UPI0035D79D00
MQIIDFSGLHPLQKKERKIMQIVPRTLIEDTLYQMEEDPEDAIHDSYGGKRLGMDRCFGVQIDSEHHIVPFFIHLTRMVDEENNDSIDIDLPIFLYNAMRSYSLGRGMIFYFPGFTISDE